MKLSELSELSKFKWGDDKYIVPNDRIKNICIYGNKIYSMEIDYAILIIKDYKRVFDEYSIIHFDYDYLDKVGYYPSGRCLHIGITGKCKTDILNDWEEYSNIDICISENKILLLEKFLKIKELIKLKSIKLQNANSSDEKYKFLLYGGDVSFNIDSNGKLHIIVSCKSSIADVEDIYRENMGSRLDIYIHSLDIGNYLLLDDMNIFDKKQIDKVVSNNDVFKLEKKKEYINNTKKIKRHFKKIFELPVNCNICGEKLYFGECDVLSNGLIGMISCDNWSGNCNSPWRKMPNIMPNHYWIDFNYKGYLKKQLINNKHININEENKREVMAREIINNLQEKYGEIYNYIKDYSNKLKNNRRY